MKSIILGGGCFWCIEAVFQQVPGVINVTSGYMGGSVKNPTYYEVSSGLTGHAEVLKIEYDSSVVSLKDLLAVFFEVHDPTTLNKQGADVGTQYRSVIFYELEEDHVVISDVIAHLEHHDRVVTQVLPVEEFYKAEDYHQDYYNQNKDAPYCRIVISPKLDKLQKLLSHKE